MDHGQDAHATAGEEVVILIFLSALSAFSAVISSAPKAEGLPLVSKNFSLRTIFLIILIWEERKNQGRRALC